MKLTTEADRDLMEHLREQLAADTPYFWWAIGPDAQDWSEVSIARFVQSGVLILRASGSYDIVVDAVEKLASAGQDTEPTGERLLQASDPEAKQFMHRGQWATAGLALERFDIKGPQLSKAATRANGLYKIKIERRKNSDGLFVYHLGGLQLLKDAITDGEE